jgi:hypothetical protein
MHLAVEAEELVGLAAVLGSRRRRVREQVDHLESI